MRIAFVGILAFSLLFSSTASGVPIYNGGKVYFVYKKKGDDGNDGLSVKRPLKTVQEALNRAMPGDTVVILPGTYYEDLVTVRDGKPDAPITVVGMPGAKIKGKREPGGKVIFVRNSYVTFEGLYLDGHYSKCNDSEDCYKDKLFYVMGSPERHLKGVKLINSTLDHALGEYVRFRFTDDSEVAYNKISHCGLREYKFGRGGKNGEGIYLGTSPNQLPEGVVDNSTNLKVHDNLIATYGSECVDLKEGVHGVKIYSNACMKSHQETTAGINLRGDNNEVFGNLIFYNDGAAVRVGGYDGYGVDNSIFGNFVDYCKFSGLKILRNPQKKVCGNVATDTVEPLVYPEDSPYASTAFKPCEDGK